MSGSGEVVGAILILFGAIFSLISAIGIVRLPDVYTRSHAASKSSTLGVLCALVGTLLYFIITDSYFSIRLILGIFFVFLTAPVAAHVLTRSAYRNEVPLAETTVEDELKDYYMENENVEKAEAERQADLNPNPIENQEKLQVTE
ncbi:Na+/H+ antiporter subunit G [Paenibacillus sp. M1]|uniref:Na+/H+ antiporter subunit G n=1 Tax=Paenibacillus haidiansis TaxID=1574488 RepID=A0ABU7W0A0_9BACL